MSSHRNAPPGPQLWLAGTAVPAASGAGLSAAIPYSVQPAPARPSRDEQSAELRTVLQDLAAFQHEEMLALQSCLDVLLHRGPRDEAQTAYELHCAARERTRQCLLRLQSWQA